MRVAIVAMLFVFGGMQVARAQSQTPLPSTPQARGAAQTQGPAQPASASDQIVAKIIAREKAEMDVIRKYSPLIETYVQQTKADPVNGWVPNGDHYFIGRANFGGAKGVVVESLAPRSSGMARSVGEGLNWLVGFNTRFMPAGFLEMVLVDPGGLSTQDYHFEYVKRQFLGEVRTVVFDVTPIGRKRKGRFVGRIWAEDESFTIVQFSGTYSSGKTLTNNFDFDSWRVNTGPNLWLPAAVYSEIKTLKYPSGSRVTFKAQTRLWGYNVARARQEEELSKIIVESNRPIRDQSLQDRDLSPLQANRAWEQEAANNVMDDFQRIGLIAPPGDVDKVLSTVTNNLEVTNNLNLDPEINCRVLMTSTIESFSIGHTIVLSRGLIDVLPDEASLAVMVAKELAYIVLDRPFDAQWAFADRIVVPDETQTFRHFDFARTPADEAASIKKATELLENSPYKDQLETAKMFVAELQERSRQIPNLISPRVGDAALAMVPISPNFTPPALNQIVALPLGGRVKVDPWDDSLQLLKTQPLRGITPQDKMAFEVTPIVLYLTRETNSTASDSQAPQ